MEITPIQYHLAGLAMVIASVLVAWFGPMEIRGWPSGVQTRSGKVVALIFVALAWPPVAFVYAFIGVVLTLQKLWQANIIERAMQIIFAVIGAVMLGGAVYWLIFVAMPFLIRWYGLA